MCVFSHPLSHVFVASSLSVSLSLSLSCAYLSLSCFCLYLCLMSVCRSLSDRPWVRPLLLSATIVIPSHTFTWGVQRVRFIL